MSPIAIIYIVTAVVSIAIALILANLARRQGQGTLAQGKKKKLINDGYLIADPNATAALKETIFEEVKQVVASRQQCNEISAKLSNVISKDVAKRIALNTQELAKKYEFVIEQKVHDEEIAWKKYQKVLTDKKETEAVIRSIAEGLVVVDAQGKVIMMNPAAEKLLGMSKNEKIGKPISDGLKEEHLISLAKGSPDKEDREIELISKQDETKKVLRASTAVIENENGKTVGMVSVLSDITKQKELDHLKSNFVANVSHELRTPLVAIDKSITLILSGSAGQLSETQEQFLSIAERNLKRLSLLINDLLDLTKLESGKIELKLKSIPIESVIQDAIEGLGAWAGSKSINIEKKTQEGLPNVNIDPDKLIQVLNNLIGNAIKFTPHGGIITVRVSSSGNSEIEVAVKDTGIGIAEENLTRVFDKFYQVGERVSTDISGTGIGLSIAKEIVELHGGKIWVESEKGEGASFIFKLPLN